MPSKSNASDSSRATTISAINNSTPPNNSVPDTNLKQASKAWRELSVAWNRVCKHADVYTDIDRAISQHSATETDLKSQKDTMEVDFRRQKSAMEAKLQAQKDQILQLESSKKDQLLAFESRYDEWRNEKSLLKSQVKSVKDSLVAAHAREIEDTKEMLQHEREKADSLFKKLGRANTETKLTKQELVISNDRLKEWERYTVLLKDVDFTSLKMKMKDFFLECYRLIGTHFRIDLPSGLLGDYNQWEKQVNGLAVSISLPPTNSPAAKAVRVAAALHVLATRLHTNIFKPCYIPETPIDCCTIKEILDYQFRVDVRQEKLMRALLLSMRTENQVKEAINRAVQTTLQDVLKRLGYFLNGGDHAFSTALEALLHHAADMWTEIQHSEKTVEAIIDYEDFPDGQWDWLKEFGETIGSEKVDILKIKTLSLFPRIYVPDDNTVVHPGCVLWADQEILLAANRELKELPARRRARGVNAVDGSGSHRARRQSTILDGRDGNSQSSPTSPRTEGSPLVRGAQRLQGGAVQD